MKTNKKYVMIVTEEDERYDGKCYDCDFYANAPWEGNLSDIVYGDNIDELRKNGENEGFFYMLYSTETGERFSYGSIDFEYVETEIVEYEKRKIKEMNTVWSREDIINALNECGVETSSTNVGKIVTSDFIKNFHDRITEFGNEVLDAQVRNVFKEKGI